MFAFFFLLIFLVIIFLLWHHKARTELITESNQKFHEYLIASGFTIDKKVEYKYMQLYLDKNNKKWTIKRGFEESRKIYNFSDLISFEVYENGNSIISGGLGGAIVGGALFGAVGSVVGSAASGKKVTGTCSSVDLRIVVDDFDLPEPEIVVFFLESETTTDTDTYKSAISGARRFASTLTYIKNCEEQHQSTAIGQTATTSQTESTESKIRQIANLMKDGILSETEYNEKKRELLSQLK